MTIASGIIVDALREYLTERWRESPLKNKFATWRGFGGVYVYFYTGYIALKTRHYDPSYSEIVEYADPNFFENLDRIMEQAGVIRCK